MQFKLTWDRLGSIVKYPGYSDPEVDFDEVAIWDRNLSTDEIAWLYNGGAGNSLGGDGGFDLSDFANLASNWLRTDCSEANQWCDGFDFNGDGSVDLSNLAEFAADWLQ